MADVQKENGYTSIAHGILENIVQVKLNATQLKVIMLVWRYTYGFHRKEHELSLEFISNAIGSDKRQLQRELKVLEDRKIISQIVINGKSRTLSFNKNYEEWIGEKTIGKTTIGKSTIGENTNPPLVNPPKEPLVNPPTKKDIKDKSKDIYSDEFDLFWTNYPRKIGKSKSLKCWNTRVKEGVKPYDLILAAENYKKEVLKLKTEERFIKHPATFIGPDKHYEDYTITKKQDKPFNQFDYDVAFQRHTDAGGDPSDFIYRP